MKASVVLSPHASKRLIARGVAAHPAVQHACNHGTILVTLGTTNAYVADELLGETVDHGAFAAGVIDGRWNLNARIAEASEIVIRAGRRVRIEAEELLSSLGPDDVVVKGGNAIDPFGTVGVLMAASSGGTVGRYVAPALARGVPIVIPISVGKSIHTSVADLALDMGSRRIELAAGLASGLFPLTGHVVTELDAFAALYGLRAVHVASGGVGAGAGSISLLLDGEESAVREAFAFVLSVSGEEEPIVRGRE